jgi:hypothetical protein
MALSGAGRPGFLAGYAERRRRPSSCSPSSAFCSTHSFIQSKTEADAEHIGQFREMLLDFVARSRAPGARDVGLAYWVLGT